MNYSEYIQSDAWRDIALRVKHRSGFRCMMCNSADNLNVHHRTYANLGNERQHMEDLICLCNDCHTSFHLVAKERKRFDYVKMHNPPEPKPMDRRPERRFTYEPMVTLTHEKLEALRTKKGGYTREILKAIGAPWPMKSGWQKKLVGRKITVATYEWAVRSVRELPQANKPRR